MGHSSSALRNEHDPISNQSLRRRRTSSSSPGSSTYNERIKRQNRSNSDEHVDDSTPQDSNSDHRPGSSTSSTAQSGLGSESGASLRHPITDISSLHSVSSSNYMTHTRTASSDGTASSSRNNAVEGPTGRFPYSPFLRPGRWPLRRLRDRALNSIRRPSIHEEEPDNSSSSASPADVGLEFMGSDSDAASSVDFGPLAPNNEFFVRRRGSDPFLDSASELYDTPPQANSSDQELVPTSSQQSSLNPENSPYLVNSPHGTEYSSSTSSSVEADNLGQDDEDQDHDQDHDQDQDRTTASSVDTRAMLARILSLASTLGMRPTSASREEGPNYYSDDTESDVNYSPRYDAALANDDLSEQSDSEDDEDDDPADLERYRQRQLDENRATESRTTDSAYPVSLISRAVDAVLNGLSNTENRNHFAFSRQLVVPGSRNNDDAGRIYVVGIRSSDDSNTSLSDSWNSRQQNEGTQEAHQHSSDGSSMTFDDLDDIDDHNLETETDFFDNFINDGDEDDGGRMDGIDAQIREIFTTRSSDRPPSGGAPSLNSSRSSRSRLRTIFHSLMRSTRRNGVSGNADSSDFAGDDGDDSTSNAPSTSSPHQRRSEARERQHSARRTPQIWTLYFFTAHNPNDPSQLASSFASMLSAPSLFSDSPSYEDLLFLEELMGQVRHPTASRREVDAAGGLEVVGSTKSTITVTESCSVCLSAYQLNEECRRLNLCGHAFHKECIDQWLVNGRNSCPLCRGEGVKSDSPSMDPLASNANNQ